jgi:hypothetical protein
MIFFKDEPTKNTMNVSGESCDYFNDFCQKSLYQDLREGHCEPPQEAWQSSLSGGGPFWIASLR